MHKRVSGHFATRTVRPTYGHFAHRQFAHRRFVNGRIVYGVKCLAWGETSMGRKVYKPTSIAMDTHQPTRNTLHARNPHSITMLRHLSTHLCIIHSLVTKSITHSSICKFTDCTWQHFLHSHFPKWQAYSDFTCFQASDVNAIILVLQLNCQWLLTYV